MKGFSRYDLSISYWVSYLTCWLKTIPLNTTLEMQLTKADLSITCV